MLGRSESAPAVEPQLTVPPTAAERLAALVARRDGERAAIQDLKADLRKASAGREPGSAGGRFRQTVMLGFSLGALIVMGLIFLLAEFLR